MPSMGKQRGSLLIVAMLLSAIIALSLTSYMQLSRTALTNSNRSYHQNAAMNLAEQGIADLAAIMEPGIAALLAVQARGVSPATAALALWQEFLSARNGLLTLVPSPGEAPPPRRFA